MATTTHPLADLLELADLLDIPVDAENPPAWDEIRAGIPDWHPRNDGEGEGEGEGAGEGEGEGAGNGNEPDWKVESRKHEKRAKAERKAREEAERKLAEHAAANQTEQEKAIVKAREEAKAEALTESQTERRNDRLEVAVTRQAAKTFADVDDALLHIQRGISAGDIDADDIFDDKGKVQTDALKTALEELLERKPHLKAADGGRAGGSSDAGKGSGGKDLDEMDVEAHLGAIKRTK